MIFDSSEWKYFRYKMEERWQRLGLQEWIDQNPRVIIAVTAISVVVLLIMVIAALMPDRPVRLEEPDMVWFYDLNTQKLFMAGRSKLPPIKTPSGPLPDGSPAGVRAYVYQEPNGAEPEIAFLEMFSSEGKESQKSYDPQKHTIEQWTRGRFFRHLKDTQWVPADSPQGQAIYMEYFRTKNEIKRKR